MKGLFFLFFFVLSKAGQIFFWNYKQNFINAGYASEFTFMFSLENDLVPSDYLRIIMPFPLHSTITNQIPNNLKVTYSEYTENRCSNSGFNLSKIYYLNDKYYIKFININGEGITLKSEITHTVVVEITGLIPEQTEGTYDPIILQTVSSISDNAIIYDSNNVFSSIALSSIPNPKGIEAYLLISDPNMNKLGAIYPIYLTILSKVTISGRGRFIISLSKNEFSFINDCKLVNGIIAFNDFSALDPRLYKCEVDTLKNIINLQINTEILANEFKINVRLQVKNPIKIISGSKINVKALFYHVNHIVAETFVNTPLLYTYKINLIGGRILLAWNQKYLMSTAPSQTLKIVRAHALTPTYNTYNAIKLLFVLEDPLVFGQEYRIEVNLGTSDSNALGSHALSGSITENLVNYGNNKVSCSIINNDQSSLTIRTLVCEKIGRLVANYEYFIAFRMHFQYDAAQSDLPADFSKISIYSKTLITIDSGVILPPTNIVTSIKTVNSENWFPASTLGVIVNSQLSSVAGVIDPITNSIGVLGLQYLNTDTAQKLVFNLNVPYAQTTSTAWVDLVTDNPIVNSAGLYIIMNPNIIIDDSPIIENSITPSGTPTVVVNKNNYNAEEKAVNIKITGDTTQTIAKLYSDYYSTRFSLKNVKINTFPSFYADEYISDFYFYTFDSINFATPTFKAFFMCNSFAITTPKAAYLYYSVANWYGGSTVANDGSMLPTFIRLSGFLRATEINSGSKRLALFFDKGLELFKNSSEIGDLTIGCGCSFSSVACYGFSDPPRSLSYHQNYINYQRVEIEFPGGVPAETYNSFHLVIPVKTYQAVYKINFFLATLQYHPNLSILSTKDYFIIKSSFRLTGDNNLLKTTQNIDFTTDYSTNTVPLADGYKISSVSAQNYNMDLTNTKVGGIKDLLVVNADHIETNNIGFNSQFSTDSKNGAGFTINLPWNFKIDSTNYDWQFSGAGPAGKCVFYNYTLDKIALKYRFGLFCPIEYYANNFAKILKITNFLMPYSSGIIIPTGVYLGYSTKTGYLASVKSFTGAMTTAGVILTPPRPASPYVLFFQSKNILIRWYLRTSNKLANEMKIRILFNNGLKYEFGRVCELKHTNPLLQKDLTCSVTPYSSTGFDFVISNCNNCPMDAGDYIIYHYGNNGPSSQIVQRSELSSIQTILNDGTIMDSISFGVNGFAIIGDINTNIQKIFADENVTLSSNNKKARNKIQFVFGTNNRELFNNEIIFLDLGGFKAINENNKGIFCSILNFTDKNKYDHRFKSIDTSNLGMIKIIVKENMFDNYYLRFVLNCENVINPIDITSDPLSIVLKIPDETDVIQSQSLIKINEISDNNYASFVDNDFYFLDKKYNSVNNVAEIFINITTSFQIKRQTSIFLTFPSYYLPKLSNQEDNLNCKSNNFNISCYLFDQRTLLITSFNQDYQSNSNISIKINGIIIPKYTTAQNFFIAFDNDTNPSYLLRYSEFLDFSLNTGIKPQNFWVYNFSIPPGFNYLRQLSEYRIDIIITSNIIKQNNVILLDFPSDWSNIFEKRMPDFSMIKQQNSTNFIKECSGFGNQIKCLIFTDAEQNNLDTYSIYIKNIINPNNYYCKPSKISISFLSPTIDVNLNVTSFFSAFNTFNIPENFLFTKNNFQKNIKFILDTDINNQSSSSNLFIIQNFYSKPVKIQIDSLGLTNFTYPLLLKVDQFNFNTYPEKIYLYPGQTDSYFQIATNSLNLAGDYILNVIISGDPYNKYAALPFFFVTVISSKVKIDVFPTTLRIPSILNGISLPVTIKLNDYLPLENIRISYFFENRTSNFSFYGSGSTQEIFTFSKENAEFSFLVKIQFIYAIVGTRTRILFDFFDKNNLIITPDPIIVFIDVDNTDIPNFAMYTSRISTGVGYNEIMMSCDQIGAIYYSIFKGTSSLEDESTIRKNALNRVKLNNKDLAQRQYGFFVNEGTNVGVNYTARVENLIGNGFNYNIIAFCVNQADQLSTTITNSFSTKSNGGALKKLIFTYERELARFEVETLICFLNTQLLIPFNNVMAQDGTYCTDLSLLIANNKTVNLETTFTNKINIYFIPTNNDNDIVTEQLNIISKDVTYFFYQVKTYLTSLPSLLTISAPEIIDQSPTAFDSEESMDFIYGFENNSTFLSVVGLKLIKKGFIYLGIDYYLNPVPNFYQLKEGLNGNGSKLVSSYMNYLDEGIEMDYNFTNIESNQGYKIYYSASNEDPGKFPSNIIVSSFYLNTSNETFSGNYQFFFKIKILIFLLIVINF